MNTYYVDGEFLPADQAMIPVDDLAVVRGIGVFDLLRTYNGKPLFLKEHVTRLQHSAQKINLDLPWSHDYICRVVLDTLARNSLEEANIRILVTGGSSRDFMTPQGSPRLIIIVTPRPKQPRWWREQGVKVITVETKRHIPDVKSINYLPAVTALSKARAQNAVEAIYLDHNGFAQEGATSNLFIFSNNTLITPGRGILSGITRKVVMEIAKEFYPIEVRDIPKQELMSAQEVFITGTNKGIVPVNQVNDIQISDGRPGKRTCHIMATLEKYTTAVQQ